MDDNFKVKPLNEAQIRISIDRLTRFKSTEDKYLRVFREIILSNLIYPKYKKKELDLMPYEKLTGITEYIFKFSFDLMGIKPQNDFSINQKLLNHEKSMFSFDKNVEKLLKNKIDYKSAINLFKEKDLPINIKWLKSLSENKNQIAERRDFSLKFPLEKIVLVEGITEEILLPKFAEVCGFDFDKNGINLISAGGKNQVVKLFYQLVENLKLPIFVLLDNDAKQNFEEIKPKLRKGDMVYILEKGEFEDILPLNLIKRTINKKFKEYFSIKLDEIRLEEPMTKILETLFKSHGFEFKKAEFATFVSKSIVSEKDVSDEVKKIFQEILNR